MTVHDRHKEYMADQRQFFDELVTQNWNYKDPKWDFFRQYEVAELFKRIQPATILDIGCGVGFRNHQMAQYDFVKHIDAIDYSQVSIDKSKQDFADEKIHYQVADFENFPSEIPYDLVVCFNLIEHLPDPLVYFEHAARLCRQGGHVAICTPNRNRSDNIAARLQGKETTMIDPMHFKEYSVADLQKIGKKFDLSNKGYFGHSINPFQLLGKFWLTGYDFYQRVTLGSRYKFAASVICVIWKKEKNSKKCLESKKSSTIL